MPRGQQGTKGTEMGEKVRFLAVFLASGKVPDLLG
jgi:hypothetical protein